MMTSTRSNWRNQPQNNRGTTLTEMLVVMAILCTGMITVAGMLNESINSLTSSLHQQQAAQLSSNLAEVLSGLPADASWPSIIPADHHCEIVTCSAEALFATIVHHWQQRIARQLPAGRGKIQSADQNGQTTARILIEWQTRGGRAAKFVIAIPVATATKSI
jgi:prepilin-type N-terminal cleavage/methylation domain-containing protein